MPTYPLTDSRRDLRVGNFQLHSRDLGPSDAPWSVTQRVLKGGRREGVELIEVNNGALTVAVVPTRGMGLWNAHCGGVRLGWDSPVTDGPVHPSFVNLMNWGGLGWLEGFDELLARCGLENNGAPYSEGDARFGLHGKIANIPAHYVAVHAGPGPDDPIRVEGHVDESKLFSTQARLTTTLTTAPGSTRFTVRDEFHNLGDAPQDAQILYHWNFGPPLLGEGARFVAAAKTVVPRNARAVEGLGHFDVYGPPEPGFAEQVYFFELHSKAPDGGPGETVVMLRDRDGAKGVALRFDTSQLPCFTLWKNTGGLKSGYVTGLEPGSNYPNPKPFEKGRGRVLMLPPGSPRVAETTFEVLTTPEAVAAVEAEVAAMARRGAPMIHPGPVGPFTPP